MSFTRLSTNDTDTGQDFRKATSATIDELIERTIVEVDPDEKDSQQEQNGPLRPSVTLRSSSWTLLLALLYATLAIFAWTILCILPFRPITTAHYCKHDTTSRELENLSVTFLDTLTSPRDNPRALFDRNEDWLRTVHVIQSVLGIVTIPLTSAVCSKAAVVYIQNVRKRGKDLSLRKTIALASRGWTDPEIYVRLCKGGNRRYGSSLLLFAIFLNILGKLSSMTPFNTY